MVKTREMTTAEVRRGSNKRNGTAIWDLITTSTYGDQWLCSNGKTTKEVFIHTKWQKGTNKKNDH